MGDTVTYERDGRIGIIRYNRPEALNAVNAELREDLNAALAAFRADDDAWVGIVTGNGRAFCVGADVKAMGQPQPPPPAGRGGSFWEVPSYESLEAGMEIWKPIIAAVNGYALGFGLTMVTACDFAIASDRAQFGFPEVRLGIPTIQGAVRAPKRVQWHHAMELLLIGERVDAARALEMGLVWKVVPHDTLMDEAYALANRLLKSAPLAVRATKEVAWRGRQMPFVEAIRFGETMRRLGRATEDAAEGPRAFREQRDPDWQGR